MGGPGNAESEEHVGRGAEWGEGGWGRQTLVRDTERESKDKCSHLRHVKHWGGRTPVRHTDRESKDRCEHLCHVKRLPIRDKDVWDGRFTLRG